MQRALLLNFDSTRKQRLKKLVAGWNVKQEENKAATVENADKPTKSRLRIFCPVILGATFLGIIIDRPLLLLVLSLLGCAFYLFSCHLKVKKILNEFDREYPTLLMVLASSVRTGADPVVAITSATQFFPANSVMGKELEKVKMMIQTGAREEEAFQNFGKEIQHQDLALLHGALLLSRKHGASLSECLMRLVKVTRQRQSFRRKIKAALAMQRFSALGIALVALFFCFMQLGTNQKAVIAALNHPYGSMLLYSGGALILSGLIWIMFLGRRRI